MLEHCIKESDPDMVRHTSGDTQIVINLRAQSKVRSQLWDHGQGGQFEGENAPGSRILHIVSSS